MDTNTYLIDTAETARLIAQTEETIARVNFRVDMFETMMMAGVFLIGLIVALFLMYRLIRYAVIGHAEHRAVNTINDAFSERLKRLDT